MGDFNVNIFCENTSTHLFLDSFISSSYTPMIFKPTRITNQTATLLDNIFINCSENVIKAGIIINDVSDHLSPFILLRGNDVSNASTNNMKIIINEENIMHEIQSSKSDSSQDKVF